MVLRQVPIFDDDTEAQKADMFQNKEDCVFRPAMGELNDWQFIHVHQVKDEGVTQADNFDLRKLHRNILKEKVAQVEGKIEKNGFGIIQVPVHPVQAPFGLKVVRWLQDSPYTLLEPTEVGDYGTAMDEG